MIQTDEATARWLLRRTELRHTGIWIKASILAGVAGFVVAAVTCPVLVRTLGEFAFPLGAMLGLFAGALAASALCVITFQELRLGMVADRIQQSRRRGECLNCEYDLRPMLATAPRPICPECGETYPCFDGPPPEPQRISSVPARLAQLLHTNEHTARQLLRIAERRWPRIIVIPLIVAVIAGALSMPVVASVLLIVLLPLAPAGVVVAVFLGFWAGVPIGVFTFQRLRVTTAAAAIDRSRQRRQCLNCGYDLRSGFPDPAQPICPECGQKSLYVPFEASPEQIGPPPLSPPAEQPSLGPPLP